MVGSFSLIRASLRLRVLIVWCLLCRSNHFIFPGECWKYPFQSHFLVFVCLCVWVSVSCLPILCSMYVGWDSLPCKRPWPLNPRHCSSFGDGSHHDTEIEVQCIHAFISRVSWFLVYLLSKHWICLYNCYWFSCATSYGASEGYPSQQGIIKDAQVCLFP